MSFALFCIIYRFCVINIQFSCRNLPIVRFPGLCIPLSSVCVANERGSENQISHVRPIFRVLSEMNYVFVGLLLIFSSLPL